MKTENNRERRYRFGIALRWLAGFYGRPEDQGPFNALASYIENGELYFVGKAKWLDKTTKGRFRMRNN